MIEMQKVSKWYGMFQVLTATEDKAEGMAAFVEKRAGNWKGR